jgi:hypothetical protein
MGVAATINQGDPFPVQDFQNPQSLTVNIYRRAISFQVDRVVFGSDYMGDAARARGKGVMNSIRLSQEYDAAEFINLATAGTTTNGVVAIDGVTLASASHLVNSGTASNILANNPVLSYTSLAAAKAALLNQRDWNGDPMMIAGPYVLLVPPGLMDFAYRLTQSSNIVGSNDNDKNIAGMQVTVCPSQFFTSTTAWMLISKPENPLVRVERGKVETSSSDHRLSIDNSMIYSAMADYGKSALDWRGIVFSSGAGA